MNARTDEGRLRDDRDHRQADAPVIDRVVSVCCLADIATWEAAARGVVRHIPARRYLVIVPDAEVERFRQRSAAPYEVIGEGHYLPAFIDHLDRRLAQGVRNRRGWYLQQFLKLAALAECPVGALAVLWDADTVPLRHLPFTDEAGRVVYYTGTERRDSYFATLERLLGMPRAIGGSFIAQCLPARGEWVQEFRAFIEQRHGKPWLEAIIDAIDFSDEASFSEYETLGTFICHRHAASIAFSSQPWWRFGNSLIGGPRRLDTFWARLLLRDDAFVAFERWDPVRHPILALGVRGAARIRRVAAKATRRLARRPRPDEVERFLAAFFASPEPKVVVQVGANDGVQNDPLRAFLVQPGRYTAVLVEPLPHYARALRTLYEGRPDITIVETALGAQRGEATIYAIAPDVADRMNGAGPANNWAHGQGSFDRDTVIHWIEANRFRGEEYVRNIPAYIAAIQGTSVPVRVAADVMPPADNLLLCVDVQGREMDVLQGVDWSRPPRYVLYEDDLGQDGAVGRFLQARGYRYVCGEADKVFERAAAGAAG